MNSIQNKARYNQILWLGQDQNSSFIYRIVNGSLIPRNFPNFWQKVPRVFKRLEFLTMIKDKRLLIRDKSPTITF